VTGGEGPAGGRARRARRDRIEIRGLRVLGVHGVLDEERRRPQPFSVDLDLWVDAAPAAASDDLADTVDYAQVAARAAALVAGRSFALLEALAGALAADALAADDRVRAVGVVVRKLRPPLALDVESVGVRTIVRREAEPADGPAARAGPAGG